jgi:mevalonate kinase
MSVKVSAPGKIHIMGEHSVVYNKPAILAAISKRCYIEAKKSENIEIESPSFGNAFFDLDESRKLAKEADKLWEKCNEKNDFTELFDAIKNIREGVLKAGIGKILNEIGSDKGVKLKIKSEIPIGSGLGSSASLAVALTKSLSELYEKNLSLENINKIAYKLEQYSHGTPSGGDNSACCFGNIIWFEKTPNKINFVGVGNLKGFILVYVKKPEKTTGELVQDVRNLKGKYREKRINKLGKSAEQMLAALQGKNKEKIKILMRIAQKNLYELGVSCPEIDELVKSVNSIGGAAKLCGAGGGGFILCYHDDKKTLKEEIIRSGYTPMEVEIGVEGVRIEN